MGEEKDHFHENYRGFKIKVEGKKVELKLRNKVQISVDRESEPVLSLVGSKHPFLVGLLDIIIGQEKLKRTPRKVKK